MEQCVSTFNPIEIARITSTLAIVLAGFSFLVLAQGIQTERKSATFTPAAFEMFGLSFIGLMVVAFLNATVVGEVKLTQRAFVLAMAQTPLLISSILLLALDSVFLLERHLRERAGAVWCIAMAAVLLGAAYSAITALDLLATTYCGRSEDVPNYHLWWLTGAYVLALTFGPILGKLVRPSLRRARAVIYIFTLLSSGFGVAVLSEVYQGSVPTRDVAVIAGGFTLLGALTIAMLLAVAVQARYSSVEI